MKKYLMILLLMLFGVSSVYASGSPSIGTSNSTTPSSAITHNSTSGLQGGTTSEYYHLTSAEYTGTGTGVFVRENSPVFTDDIKLGGTTGVKITGALGITTFESVGNTNNEALVLDLETVANQATFSSTSGIVDINFTNAAVNGNISVELQNDVQTWGIGLIGSASDILRVNDSRLGFNRLSITSGGALVLNEDGAAYDVRMESDTDANMFFLDGTNNRIGIGDATPLATFTVGSGDKFQVAGATGNIVTEGSLQMVSTGNTLSSAAGVLTIAGVGNTNNENLKIDLESVSNQVTLTSSTGVIDIDFKNAAVDGNISFDLENDVQKWGIGLIGASADILRINDSTNGFNRLEINPNGELVINEDGAAVFFRVETDGNANAFVVNSTNEILSSGLEHRFADTNTGANAGTDACLDANGALCACGTCA